MATKSYANLVNDVKLMMSGLKANTTLLSKRGLDKTFVESMSADFSRVIELDNEQESLKARLKEKTSELGSLIASLNKKYSESKKIVKIDVPKEGWKEFGINDKR